MAQKVFNLSDADDYNKAAAADLIELEGPAGGHPLFLPKGTVETVSWGLANGELIHLSGPSGTAKTSLLEYLYLVPANFLAICEHIGIEPRPLALYPIEMAVFETPGQLYESRSLKDGNTFDEASRIVQALRAAQQLRETTYPVIWLREMGRVHTASTQGALVNLMVRNGDTILPDGERLDVRGIAWITDSNYQADNGTNYSLVPLDNALKRRFSLNITMDHLQPEEEILALTNICRQQNNGNERPENEEKLIESVVTLGQLIRKYHSEGKLMSAAPPSIYGYMTFIKIALSLSHLSPPDIARNTLLGNTNSEDMNDQFAVINIAFGLMQNENTEESDATFQGV